MTVSVYDSEHATNNFGIDNGVYYLKTLASDDSVNPSGDNRTSSLRSVLPTVNAATALIGAGVSLTSGIRNLKRKEEIDYHVELSITNNTTYLLGIVEVDKHSASISASHILPGQNGSVVFSERIGPYSASDSNGSIVYMALMSADSSVRFACGISDQTDSSDSKLIQMSHLTHNIDDAPAEVSVHQPLLDLFR